jgi:hypothetical protein
LETSRLHPPHRQAADEPLICAPQPAPALLLFGYTPLAQTAILKLVDYIARELSYSFPQPAGARGMPAYRDFHSRPRGMDWAAATILVGSIFAAMALLAAV